MTHLLNGWLPWLCCWYDSVVGCSGDLRRERHVSWSEENLQGLKHCFLCIWTHVHLITCFVRSVTLLQCSCLTWLLLYRMRGKQISDANTFSSVIEGFKISKLQLTTISGLPFQYKKNSRASPKQRAKKRKAPHIFHSRPVEDFFSTRTTVLCSRPISTSLCAVAYSMLCVTPLQLALQKYLLAGLLCLCSLVPLWWYFSLCVLIV